MKQYWFHIDPFGFCSESQFYYSYYVTHASVYAWTAARTVGVFGCVSAKETRWWSSCLNTLTCKKTGGEKCFYHFNCRMVGLAASSFTCRHICWSYTAYFTNRSRWTCSSRVCLTTGSCINSSYTYVRFLSAFRIPTVSSTSSCFTLCTLFEESTGKLLLFVWMGRCRTDLLSTFCVGTVCFPLTSWLSSESYWSMQQRGVKCHSATKLKSTHIKLISRNSEEVMIFKTSDSPHWLFPALFLMDRRQIKLDVKFMPRLFL